MKITKSQLKRIIKEELEGALNEHGSERAWRRYQSRYGKNRTRDALGNRIVRKPKTDVDDDGDTDAKDVLAVAQDAADQDQMELSLDEGHEGEGSMAQRQLQSISELVNKISQQFDDSTNLEEWVEAKITKAEDYLSSVHKHMTGESPMAAPTAPEDRLAKMYDFIERSSKLAGEPQPKLPVRNPFRR